MYGLNLLKHGLTAGQGYNTANYLELSIPLAMLSMPEELSVMAYLASHYFEPTPNYNVQFITKNTFFMYSEALFHFYRTFCRVNTSWKPFH